MADPLVEFVLEEPPQQVEDFADKSESGLVGFASTRSRPGSRLRTVPGR